jgi:hypothetical protein
MSDVPSIVYISHCDDDDDDCLIEDDFYFDDDERLQKPERRLSQHLVSHVMNRPLSASQQLSVDHTWSMDIMEHIMDRDIDDKFMKMVERSEKKMSTVTVQKEGHRFDLRVDALIMDKKSQHTCCTSTTSTADNDVADCDVHGAIARKETSSNERRFSERRLPLRFWNRR